MNNSLAVLVGNGLSIAFNPNLRLEKITQKFLENLENETFDGTAVVAAMRKIARNAFPNSPDNPQDFELLVGAFENSRLYLQELSLLAENMDRESDTTLAALERLAKFAETVRKTATSHILEVIMQNSRARTSEQTVVSNFTDAICRSFPGKITFGNLNYDSLLAASLVDRHLNELTDMADGRASAKVQVANSKSFGDAFRLRKSESDYQESRLLLLHLHGSLTFWSGDSYQVKIPVSLLSDMDQWSSIRTGQAHAFPLVALTGPTDKSTVVENFPYNIAYRVFRQSLKTSSKWLIAGYSFRDKSVNKMLNEEFWGSEVRPNVFVVDKGENLTLEAISDAFGWDLDSQGSPTKWLAICRCGIEGFSTTKVWLDFISA